MPEKDGINYKGRDMTRERRRIVERRRLQFPEQISKTKRDKNVKLKRRWLGFFVYIGG